MKSRIVMCVRKNFGETDLFRLFFRFVLFVRVFVCFLLLLFVCFLLFVWILFFVFLFVWIFFVCLDFFCLQSRAPKYPIMAKSSEHPAEHVSKVTC